MISTRLLRFLNRALQFLSDLQQSLNGQMQMNCLLIYSLSTWLMSIQKAKCLSVCFYVCVYVCGWGHTERWRLATATPAISHAPAWAELKCVSRSHAGFTTLSPPKQNTVICNKRIICLLSPPFQKKKTLCIGNQLSLPSWTSCRVGSHGNVFWHCCAKVLPL